MLTLGSHDEDSSPHREARKKPRAVLTGTARSFFADGTHESATVPGLLRSVAWQNQTATQPRTLREPSLNSPTLTGLLPRVNRARQNARTRRSWQRRMKRTSSRTQTK